MADIDKDDFATQCVTSALQFGINPHYLAAAAMLRSKLKDDVANNQFGPYLWTQAEWDANPDRSNPALGGAFPSSAIKNWRDQVSVFALMSQRDYVTLQSALGQNPSALQLYQKRWPSAPDPGLTSNFQTACDDTRQAIQDALDDQLSDPTQAASTIGDPNKPVAPQPQVGGRAAGGQTGQQPPAGPQGPTSGTSGGSDAAPSLSDRVPIPPQSQFNVGLSACSESTMLKKFGAPGNLTVDCSAATGDFIRRVRLSFDVGPFKVTGLDYAVESLRQVFADVRQDNQQLYNQVKNDGMLCVRARRHSTNHFSNHSWGTAIDIFFGAAVVPLGVRSAHRGNLLLAPYFNRHGWYWGAGFSGDSVDSMHFELAEETIPKIPDQRMFDVSTASPVRTTAMAAAPPAGGFQIDPASKQVLGNIVGSMTGAQSIDQSFHAVTSAGILPEGQLAFQSELQLDTDGWPGGHGRGDDSWQPDTTLQYSGGSYVNANTVPYFVLPDAWFSQFGISVGDLGAVVFQGKLAFAVFADVGPKSKLGEGSLKLLRQLGQERLRSDGTVINSGTDGGVITIVFPGSKPDGAYRDEGTLLDFIRSRGRTLFSQLGGNLPPA